MNTSTSATIFSINCLKTNLKKDRLERAKSYAAEVRRRNPRMQVTRLTPSKEKTPWLKHCE